MAIMAAMPVLKNKDKNTKDTRRNRDGGKYWTGASQDGDGTCYNLPHLDWPQSSEVR